MNIIINVTYLSSGTDTNFSKTESTRRRLRMSTS